MGFCPEPDPEPSLSRLILQVMKPLTVAFAGLAPKNTLPSVATPTADTMMSARMRRMHGILWR